MQSSTISSDFCVYLIENLVNKKLYIGSTTKGFARRRITHINALRKGIHRNKHLQSAYNKYGEENFRFSCIKECSSSDERLEYEQFYMDSLKGIHLDLYNILPTAGDNTGWHHSEETKNQMSSSTKESWINGKMEIARKKLQEMNSRKAKAWGCVISPVGIEYNNVVNLRSFCREHNLSLSSMQRLFSKERQEYKGWKLK